MRRRMIASLTSLCLLLLPLGGPLFAAQAGGATQPPPRYKLKPGDRLNIDVIPQGLQYNKVLVIQPDGYIYYPVVGEVYATGKTVLEIKDAITLGLAMELRNYRVNVTVEPAATSAVTIEPGKVVILGAVRTPNLVQMQKDLRLVDLIALSGGGLDTADLTRIAVTRANGTKVVADLTTEVGRDLLLQPGDTVVVPGQDASGLTASALGAVIRPGPVTFVKPGMTLLDLIREAGGFVPDKANPQGGQLKRVGQAAPLDIDLRALWVLGDMSLNLPLVNGDVLIVPEINASNSVYVYGGVTKPDVYPLKGGEKLIDILVKGGAPLESANLNKVTLNRRNPDGTFTQVKLDLKRLQRSGDVSVAMVELQAGDIIMVPIRPPRGPSSFERIAAITAVISGLTSLQQLFGLQNQNNNNRNRN